MRVLVVSQYFWPENFRINDLVTELERRGHEVAVLTGVPNYPEGRILPEFRRDPARFMRYGNATVVRVPLVSRGGGRSLRLALNYASFAMCGMIVGIWRLRRCQFDVIFVFQPSPVTACLPALAIGWRGGVPVILWVCDLWPETLAAVGAVRARWLLALIGGLVRFIYRRCAMVLGQSRAFGANIARYTGDASRFRYFPTWAESLFEGALDAVDPAEEVRHLAGGFNIVFAGNIGDAQDFPTILDAADALRDRHDIRWLIVGDGRAAAAVRAEIARRALHETVLMLGRHPVERMPSFFRVASALLVTLRRDPVFALTTPGKVQAYLASGLPVVAALDGEGARVITESGGGIVCAAGDGAALARQVLALTELTPAARAEMGERGRAYCRREFDRERLMGQLEDWMEECADVASRR